MRFRNNVATALLPLLCLAWEAKARVILCDTTLGKEIVDDYEDRYPFYGDIFASAAYFDFQEIRILYEVDYVMNGQLKLFSSEYDAAGGDDNSSLLPDNPEDAENLYHPYPKLMLGDLENDSFDDIAAAAKNEEIDFVILSLDDKHYTWKEQLRWWWLREIPRVPVHKYVARPNSEPPYFIAINSVDGKFLEDILLLREEAILDYGDMSSPEIQIQIDDSTMLRGMDLFVQAFIYTIFVCCALRWLVRSAAVIDETLTPQQQQVRPRCTAEELGLGEICAGTNASHECAICLDAMPVGTKVRILPCRHHFHHDCIVGWLKEDKHTCPLCKFDLLHHFEEQKEAKEIILPPSRLSWLKRTIRKGRAWRLNRTMTADATNELLQTNGGDLELTVENSRPPNENNTRISADEGVTLVVHIQLAKAVICRLEVRKGEKKGGLTVSDDT
eukprot:scaffold981_cov119-Cylindrotheca_fusiformis.AAC.2